MKTMNELVKDYGNYEVDEEALKKIMVNPKPKTIWDLEYDDMYFFIDSRGDVCEGTWRDDGWDTGAINQGNVFLTKKEAEFEKKRREVYSTVKRYAYEFSDDEWDNFNMYKYYPFYDYTYCRIATNSNNIHRDSKLYFKSEADIEKAIEAVGEEKFKKYYLGVKKV